MKRKNFITEYLSDDSLEKIVGKIGEIEAKTSGEIRICFKKQRGFREKKSTPREVALKEFFNLGIDKTEHKTGILIFIIFNERKFEFIADEGINSKIQPVHWDEISNGIKKYFSEEKYLEGILSGLGRVGDVLVKEFPVSNDDKNELSNEIVIKP